MFTALGAHNKKAFEAAKAFNIANAIMNTYMGVTKALATYPFPFSLIPAGLALTMGMAQVQQIRSQSYSGRALGGPVMGGTPYMVGESGPELFTPSTTGNITRNQDLEGGSSVNVNFTINAVDSAGVDELLINRKAVIQQIISDAMMEKGQRGL
jgi:SLT domain-containing protein